MVSSKPGLFNPHLDGSFTEQKKLINELYAYHTFSKPLYKKTETAISALVFLVTVLERTN
jgi:hypothetical protein